MTLIIVSFLLFTAANAVNICPNQERECNRENECCSKWGYCGTGDAYCSETWDFSQDGCPECICNGEEQEEEEQEGSPSSQPSEPFGENCNCISYGDPHTKMWNCAINNWQGPHSTEPLDIYYMTRCNGYNFEDMPFDVIGVIQRYDDYFTSLDYTILKLYDAELQFCIKNKGNEGVSYNTDCSDNYNNIPNENEAIILAGVFEIIWQFENGYSKLYVKLLNKECESESEETYDLTIITQTATANEEAVEIRVSECYKQYTCGMCGDFYNTGLNFQTIDGDIIELDPGAWGGTANDETGLTYTVDYTTEIPDNDLTTTEIPMRRRMVEDTLSVIGEPCFGLRNEIEFECNAQLKEYAKCCWDRKEFCEDIIVSCGWDSCSCVMGKANNLTFAQDQNTIDVCIKSILNVSMSFACGLDSDSFVVPDMSIYEKDSESGVCMCDECIKSDAGGYIIIGIVIGFVIFGVIGVVLYFLVIKRKLNGGKHSFRETKSIEVGIEDGDVHNTTKD